MDRKNIWMDGIDGAQKNCGLNHQEMEGKSVGSIRDGKGGERGGNLITFDRYIDR